MWGYHSGIAGDTGLQGCDTVSLLGEVKTVKCTIVHSGVPRNFVWWGGVQQIQLRTEDRQNRDLGAVAL